MKFLLWILIIYILLNGCNTATKPDTVIDSKANHTILSKKDKSKNILWDESTTAIYTKTCVEAAKNNKAIDPEKYCACIVQKLKIHNIAPDKTEVLIQQHKDEIAQCAHESKNQH